MAGSDDEGEAGGGITYDKIKKWRKMLVIGGAVLLVIWGVVKIIGVLGDD